MDPLGLQENYLHVRDFMIYPIDESYSTNDLTFDVSFKDDKILLVGIEFLENVPLDIISQTACDNLIVINLDFLADTFSFRQPDILNDFIYIFRAYDGRPVKIIVNEESLLVREFESRLRI